MPKKEILYPLNKDGGLMEWCQGEPGSFYGAHEMVPNREFAATLQFTGYGRGRSAATFYFTDEHGREYPMFLSEINVVLKSKTITNGVVSGTWTFCKKGQNFSIKLVEPNP